MIQEYLIDNLKNAVGRTPQTIANTAFMYNKLCEFDAEAALFKGGKIVELVIFNLFTINQITAKTEEKHNLIKTLVDEGIIPFKLKIHFHYFGELYVRLLNSTLDDDLSDDIEQCSLSINQILKWYIHDVLPNNTSDYQIKFVNGSAITQEMIRQAILIDEAVYNQDGWVKVDICWDWLQKNPDIYIMGINTETNRVVSYLNAMPISDSYFNKIESGDFSDCQIHQNEIKSYNLPGFYKLYICSIAIDPAFKNCDIFNKILDAFISKLLHLSSKGIYITDVIADGFTDDGKRLCELYGMKKIAKSSHDSEVYKITLIPPTFNTYRNDSKKLYELYKEKFSEFEKIKLSSNFLFENKVEQETSHIEKFDVGLSFAGENRNYVEQVANNLKSKNIKVFYDDFEKVELWGKDLYSYLSKLYKDRCNYCIIFISEHYAKKLWTNHERRNAQARAFSESREYILPARFDDTEIDGIPETIGYIDVSDMSPIEFSELVIKKIQLNR